MDIGEIPTWLQSLGALIGTAGVAGLLAWQEKKKDRSDEEGIGERGGKVVMASFVDKAALDKNTAAIEGMNGRLDRICGFLERAEQDRHDQKVAQEAAERAAMRALMERGVKG